MKIMFFVLGSSGTLGHFQRTRIIMDEILSMQLSIQDSFPDKISFVVVTDTNIVTEKNIDFMGPLMKKELVKYVYVNSPANVHSNGGMLNAEYSTQIIPLISEEKPDVIVFDTFFPKDMKKISLAVVSADLVLVSRLYSDKHFDQFINSAKNQFFDRVIFVESSNPNNSDNKSDKSNLYFFEGLMRKIDVDNVDEVIDDVKKRYDVQKTDNIVIFLSGGGGYPGIEKFIDLYLKTAEELLESQKNIKPIIISGPFFKENLVKKVRNKRIKINSYEPNLIELMSISKLIVSNAGYNSVNEIVLVGTPAILIPAQRNNDDQFLRAKRISDDKKIFYFESGYLGDLTRQILKIIDGQMFADTKQINSEDWQNNGSNLQNINKNINENKTVGGIYAFSAFNEITEKNRRVVNAIIGKRGNCQIHLV